MALPHKLVGVVSVLSGLFFAISTGRSCRGLALGAEGARAGSGCSFCGEREAAEGVPKPREMQMGETGLEHVAHGHTHMYLYTRHTLCVFRVDALPV